MNLPLSFTPPHGLTGATLQEIEPFYKADDPIRRVEKASIRTFVEKHRAALAGRVLDFGAGRQPYRGFCPGEYVPLEKNDPLPQPYRFDAVLCTQVMQYLDHPQDVLENFFCALKPGGRLVLTYASTWAEVEATDLWRFTKAGMSRMLLLAGFEIQVHELRAEVIFAGFKFPLGYGAVCVKP